LANQDSGSRTYNVSHAASSRTSDEGCEILRTDRDASPQGGKAQTEMNETGQTCEKKADGQITEKIEQRCVNDSQRYRVCDAFQKPSNHFSVDLTYGNRRVKIGGVIQESASTTADGQCRSI